MSFTRLLVATTIRALQLALPVVAGYLLARELGLAGAALAALALSAALPALGALTLASVRSEAITWKNYVGGYLLPWGYALSNGKLVSIALVCGCCWLFLFGIGISAEALAAPATPSTPAPAESPMAPAFARWLLVGGWLVDGMALLYLIGTLRKNFTLSSSGGRSLLKVIAFVTSLIVVSAVLASLGHMGTAALIAAGPALALGAFYALWIGMILTVGRNTRWN
ncbi:MAG: hypothetical protein JNM84_18310 [Planctomycetes bacterium]|nr:hypothetical protein [Planctomycetota bacterium]